MVPSSSDYVPSVDDCQHVFSAGATNICLFACNTDVATVVEFDEAWATGIIKCPGVEFLAVGRFRRNRVVPRVISKILVFAKFSSSLLKLRFMDLCFPPVVVR